MEHDCVAGAWSDVIASMLGNSFIARKDFGNLII